MKVNSITPFDSDILTYDTIDASNLTPVVKQLTYVNLTPDAEIHWLLKATGLIDLTTLAGDDTLTNVHRLCCKAKYPLSRCIVTRLKEVHDWHVDNLKTAAVCVYPSQVRTCNKVFRQLGVNDLPIAAVATGFPSGQYPLETRLKEITAAIEDGATEIDIVINRTLALQRNWKAVYDEVCAMREACDVRARLKTILAVGELGSYENVYAASMVCMLAGSDFIKTSTGKEAVNATLPISLVMARAIQDFGDVYGAKVGFKPAGGLRTAKDAVDYLALILNYLGPEWVQPDLLRFGASSLLGNIETRLYQLINDGLLPAPGRLDYM
ncbi:deoxyribose-phosphate aldolase [Paragonimus westermani]|uniref:deoxyribose-phosphate aldolase n=1 Tax=Paragonimus westermani TaxID=34504 RepID=A0A5J4P3Y7_9TREM|nr:deoxyribose-phosphate aldolase [Paragonimus westermani]